jgi:hypothetical protein
LTSMMLLLLLLLLRLIHPISRRDPMGTGGRCSVGVADVGRGAQSGRRPRRS